MDTEQVVKGRAAHKPHLWFQLFKFHLQSSMVQRAIRRCKSNDKPMVAAQD